MAELYATPKQVKYVSDKLKTELTADIETVGKKAGVIAELTGTLPLTIDSDGSELIDYRIYGESVQDGTPPPEEPAEVQSVGDLVIDEIDPNYGSYKVPVTVSGENGEETTTNIYLDEPLRKIGDYADYVDFAGKKVVRNVEENEGELTALAEPVSESIDLPDLPTFAANTVIDVNTTVKPSQMYIKGWQVNPLHWDIDTLLSLTHLESWADVQKAVRSGIAGKIFSIGDQLTCQRGNDTLVWDVIGIDHDTPADPQFTHSLTLQLHDCFPTTIRFDAPEAFYYCEEELTAGTYYFIVDQTYDTTYNSYTSYQFTLTQDVPAGGQLCFGWNSQTQASAANVTSYASSTSTTAIEQVSVTEGTSGQSLGTLTRAGDFENNLNAIERVRYGSNNYKESAIRQWLNSDAAAGSVWTPQTKFDRLPSWVNSTAGFMNGMDADFLAVVGKTHLIVARNTICDGGGYDEMDDYFFLLSRRECYMGNEVSTVIEGEPYPYYSDYSDLSAAGTGADSNRIKYRNGAAQYWWTRTPHAGSDYYVRSVNPTGTLHNYGYAYSSSGVAPACCII